MRRSLLSSAVLLASSVLIPPAHADTLDIVEISGGGLTIDVALDASYTLDPTHFTGQFNTGFVPGSVNGVPTDLRLNFVFPGACAECDTITIASDSGNPSIFDPLVIGLPSLYTLDFSVPGTGTLTFLPGSYTASKFETFIPYTIDITPQTATTPEPPSLLLVGTAAFVLLWLTRRSRSGSSRTTYDATADA